MDNSSSSKDFWVNIHPTESQEIKLEVENNVNFYEVSENEDEEEDSPAIKRIERI